MAKRIIEMFTSDLSGVEGASPAHIRLNVDIDLTPAELAEFEAFADRYRAKGKPARVEVGAAKVPAVNAARDKEVRQQARLWLQRNGYNVADRGAIKTEMMDAYRTRTPHPDLLKAEAKQAAADVTEAPDVSGLVEAVKGRRVTPAVTFSNPDEPVKTVVPPARKTAAKMSAKMQAVETATEPTKKAPPTKTAATATKATAAKRTATKTDGDPGTVVQMPARKAAVRKATAAATKATPAKKTTTRKVAQQK